MEAQYRCKCGKTMMSANEQCPDCGSLGPHLFMGKNAPVVESADIPGAVRHRESFAPGYADIRESAVSPDQPPAPAEEHIPLKPSHSGGRTSEEDDSSFPAGMRSHSPMLDHIRRLDGEQTEIKKHPDKSRQHRDMGQEEQQPLYPRDSDAETAGEQEQPQPSKSGSIVPTIISIALVIILLITTLYVINNFEEITQWLSSPTMPESIQPPTE